MHHRTLLGGVCVALLLASAHASAQPPDQAPQRTGAERTPEDLEREREILRTRLERRLKQIKEIESQIESAMAKLDEGATPEEVVFSFRPDVFDLEPRDGGRNGAPRDAGPRDAGRDAPRMNPLDTPERVDAFMKTHLPDLAAWTEEFRQRNPEMAERFMDRLMRQLGPIAALEQTDPVLFTLRLDEYRVGYDILTLHREYREIASENAPDDPRAVEIKRTLATALEQRFDIKLQVLRHEIEMVEGRVTALHEELTEMESGRSQAIARQLKYFTDLSERRRSRRGDSRRGDSRDDGRKPRDDDG